MKASAEKKQDISKERLLRLFETLVEVDRENAEIVRELATATVKAVQ